MHAGVESQLVISASKINYHYISGASLLYALDDDHRPPYSLCVWLGAG